MFGANAPKLTRMIIEELKVEQAVMAGDKERDSVWDVWELSPDEKVTKSLIRIITKIFCNRFQSY